MPDWGSIAPMVQHWLPFIIIVVLLLFLIGIAFAVIGIGARGGLVWAVNEIEEGRAPRLGEAWNAGFARFWSLLGPGAPAPAAARASPAFCWRPSCSCRSSAR